LQAQVLRLNIQQAPPSSSSSSDGSQQQQQQPLVSVRVLPKEVHMNSVSLEVENFRFLFCPPERLVSDLNSNLNAKTGYSLYGVDFSVLVCESLQGAGQYADLYC
jgi:hypothetical protein